MHIGVMVDLALLSAHELERDRVDDAEALAREALDMSAHLGAEEHWMASGAHRALGLVLARHGRRAEASAELERALELARRGGYPAMVDEAIAALTELKPGGKPPPAPDSELTDRELAVLRLMAGPLSLREIGTELFVSVNTVKTHTRSIYRKLGAGSRTEAVARAREAGLLKGH